MATRQGSKRPKKAKKLKITELRSIATALQKEDAGSRLSEDVLEIVGRSKQLAVFPERQRLYNLLIPSSRQAYERLVSSLVVDYAKILAAIKRRTQYMDFQLAWLDHVRRVGEQGYVLSTSDAQPFFDGEDDTISVVTGSESINAWSDIVSDALDEMKDLSSESNFIMLHTIARGIFDHQQQQVYEHKHKPVVSVIHPAPSPDDSLFRMCGAEIARMIKVRKNEKERLKLKHTHAHDPRVQSDKFLTQHMHTK